MNYTTNRIEDYNKIINALALQPPVFDTIPDILQDVWQATLPDRETEFRYRGYQSDLIDKRICSRKDYRDDNYYLNGFYTLQLAEKGYKIFNKETSVEEIIDKELRDQNIERLEFEKLNAEVFELRNRLFDYESTKARSIRSEKVAAISALIALATLMIPLLCNKPV